MAQSATEDILSLAVIVGGFTLTGFATGTPIRFVSTSAKFTMRTGVGGLGSFTRINDSSGTLSVDLLPTADGNDALSIMHEFALSRPNGANFAASVIDTSGRFSLATQSAAISKHPDPSFGDGTGVMTWDIIATDWSQFTGGRGATPVFTLEEAQESLGINFQESAGSI